MSGITRCPELPGFPLHGNDFHDNDLKSFLQMLNAVL